MAKEDYKPSPSHLPCDEIWKNSVTIHDSNSLLTSMYMWFQLLEEIKSSSIEKEDIDQLASKYEFYEYSAKNWAVHFRASVVHESDTLLNLAVELCDVQTDPHVSFKVVAERIFGTISAGAG